MKDIRSASLSQENSDYLNEHPEITFTGLVNKLIEEYRTEEAKKHV